MQQRPWQWLILVFSLLFPAGQSLSAQSRSSSNIPRLEMGVQLVPFAISSPIIGADIGGGFHAGYNLTRNFGLDADLDFFRFGQTATQKGHTKMGLFGVRAGFTLPEGGLYVKVRPGFLHFPNTGSLQTPGPPQQNYFVLDVGAAGTYYFRNHTYVRLDLGDAIVYGNAAMPGPTGGSAGPGSRNNPMLSLGFGVHF